MRLNVFERPVSNKHETLHTINRLFRKWQNEAKLSHNVKQVELLRKHYFNTIQRLTNDEKLGFVAVELVKRPDGSCSINYFMPEQRPIDTSVQFVTNRDETHGLAIENNAPYNHPLLIEVRKTYMRSDTQYYQYETLAEFSQAVQEVIGYLRDFRFDVIVVDNTKQFTNMQG